MVQEAIQDGCGSGDVPDQLTPSPLRGRFEVMIIGQVRAERASRGRV